MYVVMFCMHLRLPRLYMKSTLRRSASWYLVLERREVKGTNKYSAPFNKLIIYLGDWTKVLFIMNFCSFVSETSVSLIVHLFGSWAEAESTTLRDLLNKGDAKPFVLIKNLKLAKSAFTGLWNYWWIYFILYLWLTSSTVFVVCRLHSSTFNLRCNKGRVQH